MRPAPLLGLLLWAPLLWPGHPLCRGEEGAEQSSMGWGASSLPGSLRREGYTVQVNVNDYLDIYCPHYNASVPEHRLEQYVLYMVNAEGYRTCNTSQGFKRWECNRPHAPHSPIKFSEKFQRYSAFSLGYEFRAGQEYYYICTWGSRMGPPPRHPSACLPLTPGPLNPTPARPQALRVPFHIPPSWDPPAHPWPGGCAHPCSEEAP
uniref:Ephrin A3 n=1 Tax=Anser brachyrhynchus TaxID=132585 RepID=A0A8B9CRP5_9AVES